MRNSIWNAVLFAALISLNAHMACAQEQLAPDIEATRVYFWDNGIGVEQTTAGKSGKVYIEAKNNGDAAVNGVGISVFDNGRTVIEKTIDIQPRETYREYIEHTLTDPGQHNLELIVDNRMSLAESNENNNRASARVNVTAMESDIRPTTFGVLKQSANGIQQTVGQGEQVSIKATVSLSGNTRQPGVPVRIEVDGQLVADTIINSNSGLEPNQFGSCETPYTFQAPGQHNLRLIIDPNNMTTDTNRSNNTTEATVNVVAGDLRPERLEFFRSRANAPSQDVAMGEDTRIRVNIFNAGNARMAMVPYRIEMDGQSIIEANAPSLDPFSNNIEATYRFQGPGQHTIRFIVDPNNTAPDADRSNNAVQATVNVTAGDLRPTQLAFLRAGSNAPTQELSMGEETKIRVTILNGNPTRLTMVPYRIEMDGQAIADATMPSIEPNASATAETTYRFQNPGQHTIRLSVDPNNTLVESDEQNNSRESVINIPAANVAMTGLRFKNSGTPPMSGDVLAGPGATSGNSGTFKITVKNTGTVQSRFTVTYTISGPNVNSAFPMAGQILEPGAECTLETPSYSFLQAGQYTVRATAAIVGNYEDINADDNSMSITVKAVAPAPQETPKANIKTKIETPKKIQKK